MSEKSLARLVADEKRAHMREPAATPFPLGEWLETAARQHGEYVTIDLDGSVRNTIRKPAATAGHERIADFVLPKVADTDGEFSHFPIGTAAGKQTTLSTALLENSRVAAAGARIITIPEQNDGQVVGGELIFVTRKMRFDVVEAANFVAVDDGDDAPAGTLPLYSAPIDLGDESNLAFRVVLSRKERNAVEAGYIENATLLAMAAGLARAADRVLLEAIMASEPEAFSLGAAAAMGFEFSELGALVGTGGTGAAVGQDGTLRAAGVLAELTPVIAGTVIGAFSRSAVAVSERITLTVKRMDLRDNLELTVFANMVPLLPLPRAFWTVGA